MKRQRLLASLAALAIVASAFAVALTPAGADTPSYSGTEWVFFPWVPNGETVSGVGPFYATVTIQNLEGETINVSAHQTAGGSASFTTTISAHSSKTLPANQLGVGSPGGPLAISADFVTPQYVQIDGEDSDIPIPPKIGAVMKQVSPNPSPSGAGTSDSHISVDGHTAIPTQDIAWGQNSTFCQDIAGDDNCNNVGAFNFGQPVGGFDGHSYLPIVQTNDGWNSVIHVSNIDASSPSAATVTMKFYTTDQQGVFSSENHGIEFTQNLDPGETWTFDLAEQNFPENWVGSAWLVSDYTMAASVNRVKAETDMVITNTAAPSIDAITAFDGFSQLDGTPAPPPEENGDDNENGPFTELQLEHFHEENGRYEMFGPLVFRDHNGWNTGISVVNLEERTINVDIQFFGSGGGASVFQDSLTISPKGQDFVYIPNDPELNGNSSFVGSVKLSSGGAFHAAIDQVKYSTGEAMSYIATAAGAQVMDTPFGYQESLSLPLVQKGSPITGLGDTSGIQLFNIDSESPVTVHVSFYNQSGNLSQPTANAPMEIQLQPHQNTTLYTMSLTGMLGNFTGSAVVTPVSGGGTVVGVSNNVNYDVEGDGSVAFNMVNSLGQFRFPASQTAPELTSITLEESGSETVGQDYTVTATALDQWGQPLPNVDITFSVSVDGDPDPAGGSGTTDVNGEVEFTYTNSFAVMDVVTATATGTGISDTVEVTWVEVPPTLEVDASDLSGTVQGGSGDIAFTLSNPTTEDGGIFYQDLRYRVSVEGPQACGAVGPWFQVTHVNFNPVDDRIGPFNSSFNCEDGALVGEWEPDDEFDLAQGDSVETFFTVRSFGINGDGTPPGIYTITMELMNVDPDGSLIGDPIVSDSDNFIILDTEEDGD